MTFIRPLVALSAICAIGACTSFETSKRAEVVATDIQRQARTAPTSLSQGAGGDQAAPTKDLYVDRLNEAQERFENNFLVSGGEIFTPEQYRAYVKGRYTHVNDLCNIYFSALVNASRESQFGKQQISLGANLATGILGVAGAAAETLSYLALGEAAFLGSFENLEEMLFLSPRPGAVFVLIKEAQTEYLKDKEETLQNLESYPVARELVRGYATLCTPLHIRQFVERQISDGKLERRNENQEKLAKLVEELTAELKSLKDGGAPAPAAAPAPAPDGVNDGDKEAATSFPLPTILDPAN